MKTKKIIEEFTMIFSITFVVSLIVTFLYNLIAHSQGFLDWETAIKLSIILAVALTWINYKERKQKF